jgi:uncharacterized protein YdeI (YjbR/CyaY-like superfamily)
MDQETKENMNPKVDEYLGKAKKWRKEFEALRGIVLECQLTEEFKWSKPCYTFRKNNIVILQGFKEFCAILFTRGALLKDPDRILEKPGENTHVARRVPFTNVQQIIKLEPNLKAYIHEAIEAEKIGLKVRTKKNPEPVPEELENKFEEVPGLKTAFEALTPGRQRAYILYFSGAKQSITRESRIEKCMQRIMNHKGLND